MGRDETARWRHRKVAMRGGAPGASALGRPTSALGRLALAPVSPFFRLNMPLNRLPFLFLLLTPSAPDVVSAPGSSAVTPPVAVSTSTPMSAVGGSGVGSLAAIPAPSMSADGTSTAGAEASTVGRDPNREPAAASGGVNCGTPTVAVVAVAVSSGPVASTDASAWNHRLEYVAVGHLPTRL